MMFDYSIHKSVMLQILRDIYSDISIAPHLGFKGGTAAHLFYNLNRDSVDLDFDLLDENKEKVVFDRVQEIASAHGKIKDSKIKRFNLFIMISYRENSHNIKIEINRRNFGSNYQPHTSQGIPMLVMTQEDMFANKLIAMHERFGKASRDIYDVWFFFKNFWRPNKEIIEKRGFTYTEILQKCIEDLENIDNRNILDGLGELLTQSQKDWARAKLIDETLFFLRMAFDFESKAPSKTH